MRIRQLYIFIMWKMKLTSKTSTLLWSTSYQTGLEKWTWTAEELDVAIQTSSTSSTSTLSENAHAHSSKSGRISRTQMLSRFPPQFHPDILSKLLNSHDASEQRTESHLKFRLMTMQQLSIASCYSGIFEMRRK